MEYPNVWTPNTSNDVTAGSLDLTTYRYDSDASLWQTKSAGPAPHPHLQASLDFPFDCTCVRDINVINYQPTSGHRSRSAPSLIMSINLGLDRLHHAIRHLPKYTRPTCHIGGTNGKGSVTAIVSSILRETSPPLSVGRFNSPHLMTIHDCIDINGQPVDAETYNSVRAEVERVDVEQNINLSSFELLTLTALQVFERIGVDIAVVEVGMGGRLDATNIIPDEAILVSALTNVDLDHQAFLGDTVLAIAREKAGIARAGRPFILGSQKYPEVVHVVEAALRDKGSYLVPLLTIHPSENTASPGLSLWSPVFRPPPAENIFFMLPHSTEKVMANFPLRGRHQLENLATALTLITALITASTPVGKNLAGLLTPLAIVRGISEVRWRGRLTFHTIQSPKPLPILVDGAHNPASAQTLADYINHIISLSTDPVIDLTYILALSHSPPKTPLETLSPVLLPHLSPGPMNRVRVHVALTQFSPPAGMPWVKYVPPSHLADVVRSIVPTADVWVADDDAAPGESLEAAILWAGNRTENAGLVVVAGSLYLVADFYRVHEGITAANLEQPICGFALREVITEELPRTH